MKYWKKWWNNVKKHSIIRERELEVQRKKNFAWKREWKRKGVNWMKIVLKDKSKE